jgi:hypothetical protein
VDSQHLIAGVSYQASAELPLIPENEPTDPLEAIAAIQLLPPREVFTVLETSLRRNIPWYMFILASVTVGLTAPHYLVKKS